MGCGPSKEKIIQEIVENSTGLVDKNIVNIIMIKTGFDENELLTLIKIFVKLKPNKKGRLTYKKFLQCPFFKYCPFGWHLLEAFELIKEGEEEEKEEEEEEEEDEKEEEEEEEKDDDDKNKKKNKKDDKKKDKKKKKDDDEEEEEEEKDDDDKTKNKNKKDDKKKDKKKKKDDDEENEEEEEKDDDDKNKKKNKKDDKKKDKKKKKDDDEEGEKEDEDTEKEKDKDKEEDTEKKDKKDKNNKKGKKKNKKAKENKKIEEIYKEPEDGIPYITFMTFCEIIYIFSSHCKPEDKTQAYFKLFDFDNDGRIGINDIKQYLKNLNEKPFNLQQRPKKKGEDSDDDSEDNNKEVNLIDINELQNKDNDTQIAQVVIREATSGNKDYLDYFDFRYLFLNTQFIPDYCHNIYLLDEIDVEPEVPINDKPEVVELNNYNEQD